MEKPEIVSLEAIQRAYRVPPLDPKPQACPICHHLTFDVRKALESHK